MQDRRLWRAKHSGIDVAQECSRWLIDGGARALATRSRFVTEMAARGSVCEPRSMPKFPDDWENAEEYLCLKRN